MTSIQLEKKLFEMINNSKMIINRRDFRTLYLVDDIKKVRKDKLNKIFNSNYVNNKNMKFSECDSFMSINYYSDSLFIKTNKEITNIITQIFNDNYYDIIKFLEHFFSKCYNLNFSDRSVSYSHYYFQEDIHLNEQKFEHDYIYKNLSEDKTLVFSFAKYKFDIFDYSYKRIVNLFRNN